VAEAHLLDHPLGAELHREVRHVHEAVGVDHRQIDDPLDAGLAGDVQRDQRLGEFVARHRVEQEQRADAGEGGAQRVDVEQVALHDLHAGREVRLRGIAGETRTSAPRLTSCWTTWRPMRPVAPVTRMVMGKSPKCVWVRGDTQDFIDPQIGR
jgi:hypothetical protein